MKKKKGGIVNENGMKVTLNGGTLILQSVERPAVQKDVEEFVADNCVVNMGETPPDPLPMEFIRSRPLILMIDQAQSLVKQIRHDLLRMQPQLQQRGLIVESLACQVVRTGADNAFDLLWRAEQEAVTKIGEHFKLMRQEKNKIGELESTVRGQEAALHDAVDNGARMRLELTAANAEVARLKRKLRRKPK